MASETLVEQKVSASRQLVEQLTKEHSPLLAAYWDLESEQGGWRLYLVPKAVKDERKLIDTASRLLIEKPYRFVFSLSDVFIDAHQIGRARAIGNYLRSPDDIGRHFKTTFTEGHYFEGVVVVYAAPELTRAHYVA